MNAPVGHKEIQRSYPSVIKRVVDQREIIPLSNRGSIEGYIIPNVSQDDLEKINNILEQSQNNLTADEIEAMSCEEVDKWAEKSINDETIAYFNSKEGKFLTSVAGDSPTHE